MQIFSERLKALRKARNARQIDMACFLGCTARHYQDYEAGKVDPPTSKLVALADYFDVSIDYLVGRSDERERK